MTTGFSDDNFGSWFLLNDYDFYFSKILLTKCACYARYVDDRGQLTVFGGGGDSKSYLGCAYHAGKEGHPHRGEVLHRTVPLMIGSSADLKIRSGVTDQAESLTSLFGMFVINGEVKTIENHLSNNLNSCHPFLKNDGTSYKWLANNVWFTFNDSGKISEAETKATFEAALEAEYALLKAPESVTRKYVDYAPFVREAIDHFPRLDQLANKTIITPGATLYRDMVSHLNRPIVLQKTVAVTERELRQEPGSLLTSSY